MKRFSQQLHNEAKTVKLRAAEKQELRERLISYMEYHPLPTELKAKVVKAPIKQDYAIENFKTIDIPFLNLFRYGAVTLAMFLVAVPLMAQKSVPGDTLYAVKVQFTEEIISNLKFGSYQKVEWETERLNRRISEARLLASEGRLTEEVEAEMAEAVKTHATNAKREIETLRTQDADVATIASIELDTTLEVQSAALRGDTATTLAATTAEFVSPEVNLIANVIDESLSNNQESEAANSLPAYEKLMARVEQNTTRIYELLNSLQSSVETEQLNDLTRRIEDIERSVQAVIEVNKEYQDTARDQMIELLQRTQKLIVYMTEIEVNQTIDIDVLLPVILTDGEKVAITDKLQKELSEKIIRIESLIPQVSDEDILAKVYFAKSNIEALSSGIATSTDNFAVFEFQAQEAINVANDVILTLEQHVISNGGLVEIDTETEVATSSESEIEEEEVSTSTESEI